MPNFGLIDILLLFPHLKFSIWQNTHYKINHSFPVLHLLISDHQCPIFLFLNASGKSNNLLQLPGILITAIRTNCREVSLYHQVIVLRQQYPPQQLHLAFRIPRMIPHPVPKWLIHLVLKSWHPLFHHSPYLSK